MALLNVNREVQDSFYRYKMPRLQAKVEGKGNGIKTVIPNMVEIAKALNRPPSYTTKYFGCELGAQVQMQVEAERYIVNGAHEAGRLQDLLDGFIKKFVLCANCANPETDLRVTSKKLIEQTCAACGHHSMIPLTHKLTTFIINNPPSKGKSDKPAKGKKRNESGEADTAGEDTISPSSTSVQDNVAQRQGAAIEVPDDDVTPDDEWSVDTSEDAVRRRANDLGSAVAGLTLTDDLERSMSERLKLFDDFVGARMRGQTFPAKEVVAEAERLDCKEKGVMVLADRLWTGDVLAKIKLYQGLYQRFTQDNPKAQKNVLHSVEAMIQKDSTLLNKVPHIIKALYDLDIVEEETILEWADNPTKKYCGKDLMNEIQAKAAPVVKWLREAEEDDDEDEEDDDVEVVYTNRTEPANGGAHVKASPAEAEDDDLDIDAI